MGGADKAYDEALAEASRQRSAILARELDLQGQVSKLQAADPQQVAAGGGVVTEMASQVTMLNTLLDGDVRQLEAWIDNHSEIRKEMATQAVALRSLLRENNDLRKQMATVQRTLDADIPTAAQRLPGL